MNRFLYDGRCLSIGWIEDCISAAYNEIKNRKGEMIDGTFVKQTL